MFHISYAYSQEKYLHVRSKYIQIHHRRAEVRKRRLNSPVYEEPNRDGAKRTASLIIHTYYVFLFFFLRSVDDKR